MKNLKLLWVLIFSGLIFSCQKSRVPIKPEILTATYEIKTYSESERGYQVFMVIDKTPEAFSVKGILFKNKLFDKIHLNNMNETEIFIDQYFPVQSQLIQNFDPPKPDNRPDGIIFEIDGKAYFYEVKFKLK